MRTPGTISRWLVIQWLPKKIFVGNTSIAWIYLLVPAGLFHVNRKGIKPPPTGLTPVAQKTYFHLNQEKEYRFRNIVTFLLVPAVFLYNKPQINYSDLRTRGVGLILLGLAVFLKPVEGRHHHHPFPGDLSFKEIKNEWKEKWQRQTLRQGSKKRRGLSYNGPERRSGTGRRKKEKQIKSNRSWGMRERELNPR